MIQYVRNHARRKSHMIYAMLNLSRMNAFEEGVKKKRESEGQIRPRRGRKEEPESGRQDLSLCLA
jgi:hypothetical protein